MVRTTLLYTSIHRNKDLNAQGVVMTILAVEKRCNHIYVASDSRYSIGDIHIDNGTKIFKENV